MDVDAAISSMFAVLLLLLAAADGACLSFPCVDSGPAGAATCINVVGGTNSSAGRLCSCMTGEGTRPDRVAWAELSTLVMRASARKPQLRDVMLRVVC